MWGAEDRHQHLVDHPGFFYLAKVNGVAGGLGKWTAVARDEHSVGNGYGLLAANSYDSDSSALPRGEGHYRIIF
jgi:hypothetical protein